jgi:hypothetical protein
MLRFFTLNENSTGVGWEKFNADICGLSFDKVRGNINNGVFREYNE